MSYDNKTNKSYFDFKRNPYDWATKELLKLYNAESSIKTKVDIIDRLITFENVREESEIEEKPNMFNDLVSKPVFGVQLKNEDADDFLEILESFLGNNNMFDDDEDEYEEIEYDD